MTTTGTIEEAQLSDYELDDYELDQVDTLLEVASQKLLMLDYLPMPGIVETIRIAQAALLGIRTALRDLHEEPMP